MDKKLVGRFCDLVRIPSPSGKERDVVLHLQKLLKKEGISSRIDGSAMKAGSNTGNLIAKIGSGGPTILFTAHTDTVEDGKRMVNPIVKNGRISSDGKTILGSDDKAGVAALVEALIELNKMKNTPTVIAAFVTREETGFGGVRNLDIKEKVDYAFDVDGSEPPGQFINQALGCFCFEVQITGKEAHSARNPDKGASAIKAAGVIVSKLKFGRDSHGGTLNVGMISGGKVFNVVAGSATLSVEVRGYDQKTVDKKVAEVRSASDAACKLTGCSYRIVEVKGMKAPAFVTTDKKIIELARKSTAACGLRFSLLKLLASVQASELSSQGYTVLGLCKGGQGPHSTKESISVKELEQTKALIMEIVKQAKVSRKP
jgi:tripeptide aminopeptidase